VEEISAAVRITADRAGRISGGEIDREAWLNRRCRCILKIGKIASMNQRTLLVQLLVNVFRIFHLVFSFTFSEISPLFQSKVRMNGCNLSNLVHDTIREKITV